MMKSFTKRLLGILIILFLIVVIEGGISYFGNHSYYGSMINLKNFGLIIGGLIGAVPAIYYLYQEKKPQIGSFLTRAALGLGIFMLLHEIISGSLIGFSAGILLLWNSTLLLVIGGLLLFAIFIFGDFLSRILKLFKTLELRETFLTFGIGLAGFLIIMQILMGFGIFHRRIIRGIIISFFVLTFSNKHNLKQHTENLNLGLETLHQKLQGKNKTLLTILLSGSLLYVFFAFNHSIIPYPTAWDANHEYLYTPKVISDNAGIIRGNQGTASTMPYLRHGFIAFSFSAWKPLTYLSTLATDTFAVNMNTWSGLFVLLFSLVTIKQAIELFSKKEKNTEKNQNSFLFARGLVLLWITSGMGAFLLFVDNKTDMGVLSFTVIALFAGLSFLKNTIKDQQNHRENLIYLILSAVFFAFAVMAKPTAFIDVVIFGMLMIGLSISKKTAIGSGIITLGLMGIIQPLYTVEFVSPTLGKIIIGIGVIIFLRGLIQKLMQSRLKSLRNPVKELLIWGGIFIISIIVFKGPWLVYNTIITKANNRSSLPKTLILGQLDTKKNQEKSENQILLTSNQRVATLTQQSETDTALLTNLENNSSLNQCKNESFSASDLSKNLQKAPGSTLREDFGRYVGFNSKNFQKSGTLGLLLKVLFRKNNHCYGLNKQAVLLCNNAELLKTPSQENLKKIENLFTNQTGKAQDIITNYYNATGNITLDSVFTDLTTYYQEHSIQTTDSTVNIPYRYLVPVNAIFNRSLQNLSSYYTDIGLVWIFIFIFFAAGLIYAIVKRNKNLTLLIGAVGIGWIIWRAIAAGIIRYGLGLIIWLIIACSCFQEQLNDEDKTGDLKPVFFAFLGGIMMIQLLLNFLRIGSQAASGPFGWYKTGVGTEQILTDNLTVTTQTNYRYGAKDVFSMQFDQYQPLIDTLKTRKDEDGVLIAGTYIQYFLHNQKNIKLDGLLSRLREEMSDYNSCKTYHRLQNEHIKYLVIDPNIGTVGRVGAGNESLFHRFFAKLNKDETTIQTHGAMTMLAKFAQDGYLKLFFTNNIGAKYAFELTNQELIAQFGSLSEEELILTRAKLAVAKFFITQKDLSLLQHIQEIFLSRISEAKGLEDLANMLNKKIDANNLYQTILEITKGNTTSIKKLSQDEKLVAYQYLALAQMLQSGQGQTALNNLIQESVFRTSQIISLEML